MGEPEAAVAILHARGPEESVLLMRRAENERDPWSAQWSLPGGRRDAGDVDLLATALRELEEECGIRLRRENLETALPERFARRRVGKFLLVAPFVFRVESELATILDPLEAAHAEWVPLRLLRDPAQHKLRSVPGVPPETLFPAVDLGAHAPLWGFTYRLLADWLGLKPVADPAAAMLAFLAERGLAITHGWQNHTAEVHGTIPVEEVLARFCGGPEVLGINRLEARPDGIRLWGPDFEEYVIRGSGAGGQGPEE